MNNKIEPNDGYVVLEIQGKEVDKRESGILVLQQENNKNAFGTVIAISKKDINDIKVGDRALYLTNTGTEFKLEGKNYLVIKESELLAVEAS